jgi:hypothetical protein
MGAEFNNRKQIEHRGISNENCNQNGRECVDFIHNNKKKKKKKNQSITRR